jgi:hypothetical protein
MFSFCVCVQFVPVATMRLNPAIFNICNLLFPCDEICFWLHGLLLLMAKLILQYYDQRMVCSPCSWLLLSLEVLIWTYWGIMAQMCAAYTKLIWGKDVVWGGRVRILHTKFIWRHHVKGMSRLVTQHRSFSNPSPWGTINRSLTHHLAPLKHFNELSIITQCDLMQSSLRIYQSLI